jgi:hypothetical protein
VVGHAEAFEKFSAEGGRAWVLGARIERDLAARKATWRRQCESSGESEVKIDTANPGRASEEMLQSLSPSTDDQISTVLR